MTATALQLPLPAADAGDMQRDRLDAAGIDLAGCEIHIICLALNAAEQRDFEAGRIGLRFETWPAPIRAEMEGCIADFLGRNTGALVAVTTAINRGSAGHGCVLALHWRPRG